LTSDVLERLSAARNLTLILPSQCVSPKIFSTISLIEKSWRGKSEQIDSNCVANAMREYFKITLVAEDGEDQSIGKSKFRCIEFENEYQMAQVIKHSISKKNRTESQESPLNLIVQDNQTFVVCSNFMKVVGTGSF
jgi:hypothetical protein